jgi:hypothetical protein
VTDVPDFRAAVSNRGEDLSGSVASVADTVTDLFRSGEKLPGFGMDFEFSGEDSSRSVMDVFPWVIHTCFTEEDFMDDAAGLSGSPADRLRHVGKKAPPAADLTGGLERQD